MSSQCTNDSLFKMRYMAIKDITKTRTVLHTN